MCGTSEEEQVSHMGKKFVFTGASQLAHCGGKRASIIMEKIRYI
jgi:hypothetical protein